MNENLLLIICAVGVVALIYLIRNIIQACGGYGAKEQSADVIMDTYEAL